MLAAPVEHHGADRAHDQHGGERQQAARVQQQRGEHSQARSADPEEAFLLAGHVGVGQMRPGAKGVVVVQKQRDDAHQAARHVRATAPQDPQRIERVLA